MLQEAVHEFAFWKQVHHKVQSHDARITDTESGRRREEAWPVSRAMTSNCSFKQRDPALQEKHADSTTDISDHGVLLVRQRRQRRSCLSGLKSRTFADDGCIGSMPQKGIVHYGLAQNRQNPLAGAFNSAIFNTFRRTRNQILYWGTPLLIGYYAMEWATER